MERGWLFCACLLMSSPCMPVTLTIVMFICYGRDGPGMALMFCGGVGGLCGYASRSGCHLSTPRCRWERSSLPYPIGAWPILVYLAPMYNKLFDVLPSFASLPVAPFLSWHHFTTPMRVIGVFTNRTIQPVSLFGKLPSRMLFHRWHDKYRGRKGLLVWHGRSWG